MRSWFALWLIVAGCGSPELESPGTPQVPANLSAKYRPRSGQLPSVLLGCRIAELRVQGCELLIDVELSQRTTQAVFYTMPMRSGFTVDLGDTYELHIRRHARRDAVHIAYGAFPHPDDHWERAWVKNFVPMCPLSAESKIQTYVVRLPLRDGLAYEAPFRRDLAPLSNYASRDLLIEVAIGHVDANAVMTTGAAGEGPPATAQCESYRPEVVFASQQWCETWSDVPESLVAQLDSETCGSRRADRVPPGSCSGGAPGGEAGEIHLGSRP